jgi:hypothetical protein
MPNTCVHIPQVGEPCGEFPFAYCFDGLACAADGVCRPHAATKPLTPPPPLGTSCGGGGDRCPAFSACSQSLGCVPAGHVGEPCPSGPGTENVCLDGICVDGVCRKKRADGENCLHGIECASGGCNGGRCATCKR